MKKIVTRKPWRESLRNFCYKLHNNIIVLFYKNYISLCLYTRVYLIMPLNLKSIWIN